MSSLGMLFLFGVAFFIPVLLVELLLLPTAAISLGDVLYPVAAIGVCGGLSRVL